MTTSEDYVVPQLVDYDFEAGSQDQTSEVSFTGISEPNILELLKNTSITQSRWNFEAHYTCSRLLLEEAVLDAVELAQNANASRIVDRLRSLPVGPEAQLEVLRNAVAHIGSEWNVDQVGFVELSLAVSQLQLALRQLGQGSSIVPSVRAPNCQILISEAETHTFAACYLEERFRLQGMHTEQVDRDHAKRLSNALSDGVCGIVCLVWNDPHLTDDINSIVQECLPIVSEKEKLFISGGYAAMNHRVWLENQGITKVFRSYEDALLATRDFIASSGCNDVAQLPYQNEIGL